MYVMAYLIGGFYAFAGAFALYRGLSAPLTDAAIADLTGDRTPLPQHLRRAFIVVVGLLVLSGGVALVLLSRHAVPMFVAAMLVQVAYLLYASRKLPPESDAQAQGRKLTGVALYIYAAATLAVIWLDQQGVLS